MKQQCVGPLQLPLNNVAVMAIDYEGTNGIATSIGHAPISGLTQASKGARNAIAEALTNVIWAPLQHGLSGVSLSANWMWPCNNEGEDARIYEAVKSVSDFCVQIGINVPTGKDSLSMKQKYPDGDVIAPGTVIISTVAHCDDINKIVEPVLAKEGGPIYYLNLSGDALRLGGSSFGQICNGIGRDAPDVVDANYFAKVFNTVQKLIRKGTIQAGHDISSGGLVTTLLEMCFADLGVGMEIDFSAFNQYDIIHCLFAENTGLILQAKSHSIEEVFAAEGIHYEKIGRPTHDGKISILHDGQSLVWQVAELRDAWYETSWLLDQHQSGTALAKARFENYKLQPLEYNFPRSFVGELPQMPAGQKIKAAIIRDQGSNSERELAHAMYLAGFEVRDVHMTDLIEGRETLEDIRFLGAVGGFSNSDVLGSAKGWAGSFLYNEKAKESLNRFFSKEDVLSIGICNGCQLFMELDLVNPEHAKKGKMAHNDSHKHESAFTSVSIQPNSSVMLQHLAGCNLGVWISHGEGKFELPMSREQYHIVAEYGYQDYPHNPNGSDYNVAMLSSADGRHLVTMPHIERSIFRWNWAYYDAERKDQVSPWLSAFIRARQWLEQNR